MGRRFFGTDGIRGRVGEPPITADFILKLGWAAGRALVSQGCNKVLIGKDTRISGYMFESALEAGLSAAGLDIALLGPMPTPGIAYLTRTLNACAGVVISASHNPYYDNGIKFFSRDGAKLPDELEARIEALLDEPLTTAESSALGKAERIEDARGRYIEFCKSTLPSRISLRHLKIVVDCAHGATYHIAPSVFSELGAQVVPMGVSPNGLNINDGVGSTQPELLRQAVIAEQADLGIAFDGDGDRVAMVDGNGRVLNGDDLLYVIARDRLRAGQLPGGAVVGTLMSNLGLEVAFNELGIDLHRAKVGDRYVMQLLNQHGLMIGGEGSGHIICLDRTTTGDGIVSALQVVAAMVTADVTLAELTQGMSQYPQHLVNVPVAKQKDPADSKRIQEAVRQAELELGVRGRVLLRPSGTEPVIRVMVEGEDEGQVASLASALAGTVREAMAG
jgi:phosphoglucosamine mutase